MFPFHPRPRRMVERGAFKYMILQALKKKPMHGYELMRVISDQFSGYYTPSAGLVYPTLQMLEDMDYISPKEELGKKVYSITEKGEKFLSECKSPWEPSKEHPPFNSDRMDLNKELKCLAKTIFTNYWNLTPEQIKKVGAIIAKTRRKLKEIMMGVE